MDAIVLKSFLPEIFLSSAILLQILLNTKFVNSLKLNFPLIEKELFYQNLFILIVLFILLKDLRIEGYLGTYTLCSNLGINFVKELFVLICFLVVIVAYNIHYFQKINFFEFSSLLFLSILGLLITISSQDLLVFYIVMEIQALCFYVLSSSNRTSIFSVESGLKYFISGSFMSGVYLLGASFIYASLGTINLHSISLILSHDLYVYNESLSVFFLIGAVLVVVTMLFKLACGPFHFWSPDVYDGAPLASTVIFSIVPKLPLYYFFITFLIAIKGMMYSNEAISGILLTCGLLSVFLGTFFALSQRRVKRLIVYSSVVQTGFIVIGLGAFSHPVNGFSHSITYLIVYIITSLLIWGVLVAFYLFSYKTNSFDKNEESDVLYISTLKNLLKYNAGWTLLFIIIFFSIGGIPPFPGFLVKMLIVLNLVEEEYIFIPVLLIVISSISVYYYIRLIKVVFFEPKKNIVSKEFKINYSENSLNLLILILILLIIILLFAFYKPTSILLASQLIVLNILSL